MLKEKFNMSIEMSRKVAQMLEGGSIKELLELSELVDKKEDFSEW